MLLVSEIYNFFCGSDNSDLQNICKSDLQNVTCRSNLQNTVLKSNLRKVICKSELQNVVCKLDLQNVVFLSQIYEIFGLRILDFVCFDIINGKEINVSV